MILGFPSDVAGFALLQCILAQRLGVAPGVYTHSISNAHVYDNHYNGAKELLKRKNNHKKIVVTLPKKAFERAEKKDVKLVEEIVENIASQYSPMEAIKGLTIVL
jgi:thymidylate synthase